MYLGAYLGIEDSVVSVTVTLGGPGDVQSVDTPYTPTSPEYVDHVAKAIERLCEYAKSGEFTADPVEDQLGFDVPVGGGFA